MTGRVLDAGGLALPGATITVTEQNTGYSRTVVTADTGGYAIANLDPGVYAVVVEMPGFAAFKQANLTLTSGLVMTLELRLQIAGVQEAVTVTGETPLVETTSHSRDSLRPARPAARQRFL
jgi:hypothetical protein